MNPTPDSTLDPQQLIAELQRQLADAQRRLDERTAERDEGEAQKAAMAEVLGVINSSPGDLTPVFEAILEKAHLLCSAAVGALFLYDGEINRAAAVHGYPEDVAETLRNGVRPPPPLLDGARMVHRDDAREDAEPVSRLISQRGGVRTNLLIPLRKDGVFLGMISCNRQEVRPYSDKEISLIENFAAQAVIAIENARLITETREALEQQTATAEVLGVINSSPGDLAPVFDAMLEKAMRLCGAAFGMMALDEGEQARTVAALGVPAEFAEFRNRNPMRPNQAGIRDRLHSGESVVQIADMKDDDLYRSGDAHRRALVDLGGARTCLAVALRRDRDFLGGILIYRQEVRLFSDKQIALLQNFAAQAVIAMENARLITETREALEQQTATAEVLGVINSSPGDLGPVFDVMLVKATHLCDAAFGIMSMYDGERFQWGAVHNVPEAYTEFMRREPPQPSPKSALGRIRGGERVVQIEDYARDEGYDGDDPRRRALVELGGARSYVAVGLYKDDKLLGTLAAYRQELRPFSEREIALLQNFAAQAVIAMENARLITETREALEQQTATAEVLQVINSSPGDLTPVFDAMLEKAMRLCDFDLASLWTYDGNDFHPVAMHGVPERFAEFLKENTPPAFVRLLSSDEPFIHFADVMATELGDTDFAHSVQELGQVRTLLLVPLRKDGAMLGVFTVYRREVRPFSDKQIALLQNFAAQAVIAMENARLITETREALEQQTATAEVLQVINSSPGDLAPVFDAMLEKAHSLCDVAVGALEMWDGVRLRAVATRGLAREFDDLVRRGFEPQTNDPVWSLVKGEPYVHVDDLGQVDEPTAQEAVAHVGVGTFLAVALRKDDLLLGRIVAVRQEVRPFTDKQIALLQNFAAQAVIAMENARLLGELRQRTEEVGELNRDLEARVAEQVDELGRVGRLKRFLAPQLAELIVSQGDEKILESHRREIVVVFCDLRGYTAFTETAEPEEVLDFLRQYHGALGPLVSQFEGTLDQFSGDGIMVFFNDPMPIPDPAERAVKMAVAMREAARELIAAWSRHGCELGFGAGIAQGFATLGQIGFSERSGYTAIGTVCNLAARLCAEAKDGQILVSSRIAEAVEAVARLEDLGNLDLKGLRRPVAAFNVVQSTSPAEARPNLTVVARDTGA